MKPQARTNLGSKSLMGKSRASPLHRTLASIYTRSGFKAIDGRKSNSMKRIRLDRWASQLQPPRNPRIAGAGALQQRRPFSIPTTSRSARRALQHRDDQPQHPWHSQRRQASTRRRSSTAAATLSIDQDDDADIIHPPTRSPPPTQPLNFPSHRQALQSAKISSLHARLHLPSKLPLQTLARCLIDPSVDARPGYNNAPLALLGQELLGYYTAEYLLCHYPRLPMPIVFAAQHAYVGAPTLGQMRAEWGVEVVAAPGPEVDGGLLQLKRMPAGNAMAEGGGRRIKDVETGREKVGVSGRRDGSNYRRGMSSRIVYDDQFGDLHTFHTDDAAPFVGAPSTTSAAKPSTIQDAVENPLESSAPSQPASEEEPYIPLQGIRDETPSITAPSETQPTTVEAASASFIRAVAGALYLHAGTAASKKFHADHILSRHLPLHTLFHFSHPTRDLSRLCAREGFEPPVARLISETGRHSRTPVFVVGVFSGDDKLGEGAGSSLNEGRVRAAAAALRSWYLYSPAEDDIVLPSEVEGTGGKGKKWKAQMVDMGEIVT